MMYKDLWIWQPTPSPANLPSNLSASESELMSGKLQLIGGGKGLGIKAIYPPAVFIYLPEVVRRMKGALISENENKDTSYFRKRQKTKIMKKLLASYFRT